MFFKKYNIKFSTPFFIFLLSLIILNTILVTRFAFQKKLAANTFRLHVVANTNDKQDQEIKLNIAEKINNYLKDELTNCNTKNESMSKIYYNLDNIIDLANNELESNDINYTASAKIGKIAYEEKTKDNYTMPAGTYDSVQIILGEGKGKNFWNILFPNENNIKNLKGLDTILPGISSIYEDNNNDLDEEIKKDIVQEKKVGFKLLEIFENLKHTDI